MNKITKEDLSSVIDWTQNHIVRKEAPFQQRPRLMQICMFDTFTNST